MISVGMQKGTLKKNGKRGSDGCGTISQGTKSSSSISSFFSRAPAAAFFPFSTALDVVCSVFAFASLLVPTVKLENDTISHESSPREEKNATRAQNERKGEVEDSKQIHYNAGNEDVPTASFTF